MFSIFKRKNKTKEEEKQEIVEEISTQEDVDQIEQVQEQVLNKMKK
jgi:hypothetical protein